MGLIEQLVGLSDSEKDAQLQAMVDGEIKAKMSAHRFKNAQVARSWHDHSKYLEEHYARIGYPCMAHAKRLQAKYWARRMGLTNEARYEQLKLDVAGYSYVDQLMRRQG